MSHSIFFTIPLLITLVSRCHIGTLVMAGVITIKDATEEEYERQFFGFCSRDVYEGVKLRIMPDAIANSAEALKSCLIQNFEEEEQKLKIISACDELIKVSKSEAEKPLEKLRSVLDGFFQIPPSVLFAEDSVQKKQYDITEVEQVDRDLVELAAGFKQGKYMEECLSKELEEIVKFEGTVKEFKISDIETEANQCSKAQLLNKASKKVLKINKAITKLENESKKYLHNHQPDEDESLEEIWNCTVE